MKSVTSIRALALVGALCLGSGVPAASASESDLANMVQAEYDFSAAAKASGYKASFLQFLADDAVLFDNGPVNGRKFVAGRADLPGLLQWYPSYAVVSSSGTLGLSTGPWVYSVNGKAAGFGHFFSIWKRGADGKWHVMLDQGIDHDEIKPAPARLRVDDPSRHANDREDAEGESVPAGDRAADIRAAEREFALLAADAGYAAAAEQMAHANLRVYRDQHVPVVGAIPAVAYLREKGAVGTLRVDFAAGSGDLGYAYGMVAKPGEASAFSHIFIHAWKQEQGRWQLLGDVFTPVVEKKH